MMFGTMSLGPVFSGRTGPSVTYFAGALALWAIAGYMFGACIWRMNEKRFHPIENTQPGAQVDGPTSAVCVAGTPIAGSGSHGTVAAQSAAQS